MAGDKRAGREPGSETRLKGFLLPLLTGAALASGCGTVGTTASAPTGLSGCSSTADLRFASDYELGEMAAACRAAAQDVRATNLQASIANYNAGRAWRAMGQNQSGPPDPPSAPVWSDATRALEAALANLRPPTPGARPSRDSDLIEGTWANAKLELAQVRSFMWDWDGALQHASDVYDRFSNGRQVQAMYTRAEIYLRRYAVDPNPSYRERAFDDLSRLSVYQYDDNPDVQSAQRLVVELAKTLGDRALAEGNLDRARSVFVAGREAARAMSRNSGAGDNDIHVATFNLGLGKVEVLRAGLRGPDELGGCERRQLNSIALRAAVNEHLNSTLPEAHRWAGCALLAIGEPSQALGRFEAAAQTAEGRGNANTQISLARALGEAARNQSAGAQSLEYRDRSLRVYSAALGLLASDADTQKRAVALAEAADGILSTASLPLARDWRPAGCETRIAAASANDPLARADSPAYACAVSLLQEAIELAPDMPQPRLQLGALYADMIDNAPEGPRLRTVFDAAFTNVNVAVSRAGEDNDLRARANFELSGIAQSGRARGIALAPAARGGERRLEVIAVSSADEAARLAPERYTSQACLARLSTFGRLTLVQRYRDQGRALLNDSGRYCETDRNNPQALLYEGMYHLARTYQLGGAEQSLAWETALESFQQGEAALDADLTGNWSAQARSVLREQLLTGQAISYNCAGFVNAGRAITARTTRAGDEYFAAYGFDVCAARRTR